MSQLVNAEVNSGNSSTSNYILQLRIRECHVTTARAHELLTSNICS